MRRVDPFDRPADAILWALRRRGVDYRCTPSLYAWIARCPVCGGGIAGGLTVRITEAGFGGPVTVSCSTGCREPDVLAALAAPAPATAPDDDLDFDFDFDFEVRAQRFLDSLPAPRVRSAA